MSTENKMTPGVYFSFLVSEEDAKKLHDFGQNSLGLDMKNSGSEYEYRKHSTLFASKEVNAEVDYQKIVEEKKEQCITVKPIGWKLIKSHNTGKTCLALIIDSEELLTSHKEIKEMTGLTHAFSDFITHISIHYDFPITSETLKNMPLPDFDITLDRLFTKDYHNNPLSKTEQPKDNTDFIPHIESKENALSNIRNIRKMRNNTSVNDEIKKNKI